MITKEKFKNKLKNLIGTDKISIETEYIPEINNYDWIITLIKGQYIFYVTIFCGDNNEDKCMLQIFNNTKYEKDIEGSFVKIFKVLIELSNIY